MKKFFAIGMALFFAIALNAQVHEVGLPTSLKQTMKDMNKALKLVSAQINDSAKNESSALLTEQVVALTLHSKEFTPEAVLNLPPSEREVAKSEYDKSLDQSAELGKSLANALRGNDNELAKNILSQMSVAKKDGHDRFKP